MNVIRWGKEWDVVCLFGWKGRSLSVWSQSRLMVRWPSQPSGVTVKRSLFIVSIRTAYQSDALAIQPSVHNSVYAIYALSFLFVLWIKKDWCLKSFLAKKQRLSVRLIPINANYRSFGKTRWPKKGFPFDCLCTAPIINQKQWRSTSGADQFASLSLRYSSYLLQRFAAVHIWRKGIEDCFVVHRKRRQHFSRNGSRRKYRGKSDRFEVWAFPFHCRSAAIMGQKMWRKVRQQYVEEEETVEEEKKAEEEEVEEERRRRKIRHRRRLACFSWQLGANADWHVGGGEVWSGCSFFESKILTDWKMKMKRKEEIIFKHHVKRPFHMNKYHLAML